MSSGPQPGQLYRLRAVGQNDSGPELYATHQGPDRNVIVTPRVDIPDYAVSRQVWEYLPSGHIRALGAGHPDQSHLRSSSDSFVGLGEPQALTVLPVNEGGQQLYTIQGPWRQGVYGANDWFGVRGQDLFIVTRHNVQETGLDRFYWDFVPERQY
ncbi:unnamed protein product [Rhizoctonia solani]|uniref:Uncharacterized protein n=1 Tax=Rhizoctonia solani TaxID=456999 RepID=A0A8H3CT97_9AGAM|nr:unnamed protein product [Rhizoctonia solani]